MIDGRQYVAIAAGGSGKNATKSGDSIIAFALPSDAQTDAADSRVSTDGWIELFDGSTVNGWVHMNGAHRFTVEDGAIVGRTVESSASMNSFLCSIREFGDFELELETTIDRITNSGIQIRSQVRPLQGTGRGFESAAGRVNGPQVRGSPLPAFCTARRWGPTGCRPSRRLTMAIVISSTKAGTSCESSLEGRAFRRG
jgi:quinoprotein glucose dehydrogenase